MNSFTRRVLFFLFFLSGFSSLVYQVVWTRMAFASFGIITPVLSVVLSVYMLGLAIGSSVGGRFIQFLVNKTGVSGILFYAVAELVTGLGAFVVPQLFAVSEHLLLTTGQMNSIGYLLLSALALAISILPWCICMGTTFPFMMAFIRETDKQNTEGFSFLYLANVLGAMCGTFCTAVVLVEILGFRHTLWVAAAGNFSIFFISAALGWKNRPILSPIPVPVKEPEPVIPTDSAGFRVGSYKLILFATGFIAMAAEVIWSRAFTPVLKTQVYSFALIIFTYLGATFLGSWSYRQDLHTKEVKAKSMILFVLALTAFLPVLANDPRFVVHNFWDSRIDFTSALLLLGSICPFCAFLGYLTPSLVDEYAKGSPALVGQAYAINVLGCIVGPLAACYLLLPLLSERHALILLALPLMAFWFVYSRSTPYTTRLKYGLTLALLATWSLFFSRDFEGHLLKTAKHTTVRRDYAATVIAFGDTDKWLLVNGFGMTKLTPITKFIAHLPLAFHRGKPTSALVICFGMGTTYRSALTWDIDTTTVELVPSVIKTFSFYHPDAPKYLLNPQGHIIIDDGRRYLKRTDKKFDVIVVDPPPPIEAAGSSLLYSKEFYALARQHLNPNGILQMWFPGGGETVTQQAVIRSINESFPHVRCFSSMQGWGIHLLASMEPFQNLDASGVASRLPEAAKKDLLEWAGAQDAVGYMGIVITNELSVPLSLNPNPDIQITDDHPFNEYFLLRNLRE